MLNLSSASLAKPRSSSAVIFRVALLITIVRNGLAKCRTNTKHGQMGNLRYHTAACANAYGYNLRYVTASELM